MEHKIEILSPEISNKIAAGEVVQRPLSVVKELVENSIDAQAKNIKIFLKNAGLEEISIIDDGIGMNRENVEICLLRHATSKVKEESDIYSISTLGFRGEALPSIAAVSKFRLTTSTDGITGYELVKEGDRPQEVKEVSANQGTQISIGNLFYNTPARFKHLSSTFYELSLIIQYVNKAALTNPAISFELINNNNSVFSSLGDGNVVNVMHKIYNNEIAKNIISCTAENNDFKVDFYLVKPQHTRSKKNNIHIGVNGRIIKNLAIENMIVRGYGSYLHTGQFPIVYINITTDASLIDINIHPTKEQIKIALIKNLETLIVTSIKEALNKEEYISRPNIVQQKPLYENESSENLKIEEINLLDKLFDDQSPTPKKENETETAVDSKIIENNNRVLNHSTEEVLEANNTLVLNEETFKDNKTSTLNEPITDYNNSENSNVSNIPEQTDIINPIKFEGKQTLIKGGKYIGIHHKTYIIYENEEGIYFIDQHAAQERINYEMISERLSSKKYNIQKVLLPIIFDFTQNEFLLIEEKLEEFETLGLKFEKFGHNTLRLVEVDSWYLKVENIKNQIRWIIDTIAHENKLTYSQIVDEVAISMACKGSIKAHQYISQEDAESLLEELSACHEPYTCPHGRPIIVNLDNYQIKKMFKRVN